MVDLFDTHTLHTHVTHTLHTPQQAGLLALLITGRLALVRWQLQTYLEYGAVLALYDSLAQADKPEAIDNMGVRAIFSVSFVGDV